MNENNVIFHSISFVYILFSYKWFKIYIQFFSINYVFTLCDIMEYFFT